MKLLPSQAGFVHLRLRAVVLVAVAEAPVTGPGASVLACWLVYIRSKSKPASVELAVFDTKTARVLTPAGRNNPGHSKHSNQAVSKTPRLRTSANAVGVARSAGDPAGAMPCGKWLPMAATLACRAVVSTADN